MMSKINDSLVPTVLNVLQPHRGPITSIIINSDGKRFLTASNDYTIKESTLEGTYTTLRKHQGRVNVMRMIDDKLYSGGNDCKLKF
jgi:WD40 repeat protein